MSLVILYADPIIPSISNLKIVTDEMFQFDKDDKSSLSVMLYETY